MKRIKGKSREQVSQEGYRRFCKELRGQKWKIVSPIEDYKNTKSKIEVICPSNHKTTTTHNRFTAGHGCKECSRSKQRKHTIDSIRVDFEAKGYTLLETKYINNSLPMRCLCKCGRETTIAYNNLTRNISGCIQCTGRLTQDDATVIIERSGCTLLSTHEFVLNETHITYRCVCENTHTGPWKTFKNGARCPECTKVKYKNTCNELYGVDNSFQYEEFKEKGRQTMIELYNGPYTMSSNLKEQTIAANKANNGGQHNLATPEIRELSARAYEEKHGCKFGYNPEHQEKARISHKNNTGYDYPMQNPTSLSKRNKTAFSAKDYTFPSGRVTTIQGYEHYALDDLIDIYEVDEDDIITGEVNVPQIEYEFDSKTCYYHPDIYIKSLNMLIEVKSIRTLELSYRKNIKKFQASAQEYNFILWVYDKKGNMIQERIFHKTPILRFI